MRTGVFQVKTMAQIFLSYAREDEEKVENLYQKLSAARFKPWMDKKNILPGERWKSSIRKAIQCSDFFLACLSANSVSKRGFLQKEIKDALDIWQEKLDSDIYLIPVRLDDCKVLGSLSDFQWVNLFEEDGLTRLVKAIQVGMERRAEVTADEEPSSRRETTTPEESSERVLPHDLGTPAPLRWLHLSDFHVGKDDYGQRRLFKYLLDHVRERVESGAGPDVVFITGDIADKGQADQYDDFFDSFFVPLWGLLSPECQERIFIVPGNHDVDQAQARAVDTYDILLRIREFLDPTDQGQFERSTIFPRLQAYADYDFTNSGDHWLFSSEGALIRSLEIRGHKIGILSLNTAWLSCSDEDRHQLSLGKGILEVGLETLQDCELKIVLGHHPIDWFLDAELAPVEIAQNSV